MAASVFENRVQTILGLPCVSQGNLSYIDLQSKCNMKLSENMHSGEPGDNNLAELPKGDQTFGGVKFWIGEGLVQLGSQERDLRQPEKVEGIQIHRNLTALYILHGTQHGDVPDHTVIGKYKVNYSDATDEAVPIVCGEDLRTGGTLTSPRPCLAGRSCGKEATQWPGQEI